MVPCPLMSQGSASIRDMNNDDDHHDQTERHSPEGSGEPAGPDDGQERPGAPAPFGFPVLAELPELAAALADLREVDRLLARVIDTMVVLQDDGEVERVTGVAIGHWLSIVAGRTGSDVRMLRCAVRACRRLPSLYAAFSGGSISWAQTRAVALRTDRVPMLDDDALDAAVADAIHACEGSEPDALARMVGWAISSLLPPPEDDDDRPIERQGFLALQPRLDGSGGTAYAELDSVSFAVLDAATATDGPPRVAPTRSRFAGPTDPQAAAEVARISGRERLTNLIAHLTNGRTDEVADDPEDGQGSAPAVPGPAAGHLLLRAELDTLIGRSGLPAQLLITLAGGAMHVDGPTARKLAEHAPSLRLVITDGGKVVGVGRRTRTPPAWLREAILALHDTCSAPGCERSALTAQLDHGVPWEAGGPTDVANCGPLCGHDNLQKEREGWRVEGRADGARRWHHPRSGLTVRTHPATRRPPPRPPNEPPERDGAPHPADEVPTGAEPLSPPPFPPPPDDPDA
jgi:hypothetical protein